MHDGLRLKPLFITKEGKSEKQCGLWKWKMEMVLVSAYLIDLII